MCRLKVSFLIFLISIFQFENIHVSALNNEQVSLCSQESPHGCMCSLVMDKSIRLVSQNVDCSSRDIVSMDNSMLIPKATERLDFSGNLLTTVEKNGFLNSTFLIVLNLNKNKIKNVAKFAFKDVQNLEVLDLSHNLIETLDSDVFSEAYGLVTIDLSYNNLKKFSSKMFMDLQNLLKLNLNNNNKELGSFMTNTAEVLDEVLCLNDMLEDILLENINITHLPDGFFSSFHNLRKISLAKNEITSFPKLPFTIDYLDVSSANISLFSPSNFTNLPELKHLIANHLYDLREIQNDTFKYLHLERFSLEDCKNLETISPQIFHANQSDLKYLSFFGSGLQELNENWFPILSKLTYLDLRGNPWMCDCYIKWVRNLKVKETHKEFIQCFAPRSLAYQPIWSVDEKNFRCLSHLELIKWLTVNGLILFCVLLVVLVIWLIYLWPPILKSRNVAPQSQYYNVNISPNRAEDAYY